MTEVKVIVEETTDELQDKINKFLKNPIMEFIDIKFSSAVSPGVHNERVIAKAHIYFSAIIIYKNIIPP